MGNAQKLSDHEKSNQANKDDEQDGKINPGIFPETSFFTPVFFLFELGLEVLIELLDILLNVIFIPDPAESFHGFLHEGIFPHHLLHFLPLGSRKVAAEVINQFLVVNALVAVG
jgi:hypothetical protein